MLPFHKYRGSPNWLCQVLGLWQGYNRPSPGGQHHHGISSLFGARFCIWLPAWEIQDPKILKFQHSLHLW